MTPAAWLVGALLGMRHALEPDHIVAVGTLVADGRRRVVRGVALGALWGVGHTVALMGVTGALAAFGARLPDRLSTLFELAVASMLIVLGARSVRLALRSSRGPSTATSAEEPLAAPASLRARAASPGRPFLVGVVHGLAGSGTLTVLTLVSLPTTLDRMLYAAVFGAGSVVGMGGLAGCASVVAARFAGGPNPLRLMPAAAGVLSVIMGLAWGCAILRATVL